MDAYTETHVITFQRDMDRALQGRSFLTSVDKIIDTIGTKAIRNDGWGFDVDPTGFTDHSDELDPDAKLRRRFRWNLNVTFSNPNRPPNGNEFANILYTIAKKSQTEHYGQWVLTEVDSKPYAMPKDDDTVSSRYDKENVGYAPCVIPADWDSYFEDMYGLDDQIAEIKDAIQTAIMSNWDQRFSVVLYGPPGCGKSAVLERVRNALGMAALRIFDATATTAAGMIQELEDQPIIPRILGFEELEKAPSDTSTQPLLGVLDSRGAVNKTTARGKVDKETKCLGIATVNDEKLFGRMQAGALASRFSVPVYFPRPGREYQLQILRREIDKIGGDRDWAEPALEYCEKRGIKDTRQMISICLVGKAGLLDGTYQARRDRISQPFEDEGE